MIILQVLLIVFCLVILLLLLVLITPFVLYINTNTDIYYVKLTALAKVRLLLPGGQPLIHIRVLFLNFTLDPLKTRKKKKKKPKAKIRKPSGKKSVLKSMTAGRKMVHQIFRSSKIELQAEFDTGDVIRNAFLIPVSFLVNGDDISFSVNNNGINNIMIRIQNRLIVLLILFIRFRIRRR